ncbi:MULTISPECIES: MFS transporter [Thioclava]|uniref:MFS transporter n=1 Tax=Thioclava nitratireducens TaxID=1915078 RepID=A0ABN4XEI7_9RHOB|nr:MULTISPECIES: MFS transporter [Thioclava]AQS47913.1 MFS transporter [Thioclava nitratireducens]OWY05344.1 MFS transporter [Thioclava sp. F1Mire-8]OWY07030.1 MFS transporter [Thioclava sp. IC9]OWY10635.1 MFS transporter [Thioclava sp. F42-5]OWY12615.1 MFS transporter [Thioclava sp. F34-6]
MLLVLRQTWPLLLGIMLLMVGNGMQGTLLGIRGKIEGINTFYMSLVMSAYFAGFLFGSRMVPEMIARVGHVRVFAALGSLISAVLILYAAFPNWPAWVAMRVLIGFSFSGVYITAESWLNAGSTNETRGQALSLYMIMQMFGIVTAQALLNVGDPAGYLLFVIPSVLVSLSFTPILLAASPAPSFETIQRMTFKRLWEASPLGMVGLFLLGGIISAMFGMASVWGTAEGLDVKQISAFVAAIYVGGLVLQYPIGWASDRMDRRRVIMGAALAGAVVTFTIFALNPPFWVLLIGATLIGGVANPLYSLLIAYTNDYLDSSDMAAASAGLMFVNGLGAVAGPLVTGWLMSVMGPGGFFLYIGVLCAAIAGYAVWRMTRREAPSVDETGSYTLLSPTATAVAVEARLEVAQEEAEAASEEEAETEAAKNEDAAA